MDNQHCLCLETLSNAVRMDLLKALAEGPAKVSELAKTVGRERSLISHALQQLRACRLVSDERKGREVYYALNAKSPLFREHKGTIFTIMENHARQCCETCVKHGKKPFEIQ